MSLDWRSESQREQQFTEALDVIFNFFSSSSSEKVIVDHINEAIDDGLNYVRGNLAIACLATEEKRGGGQAKRYLRPITSKLFDTREWTYNMAVVYYQFAYMSARENKKEGGRNWRTTAASENISKSIQLFQKVIKQDKLFLTAYENLIYIYKEQREYKKAEKVVNSAKKTRLKLME